jgi:membrane-bound metal-dependent hydrolase YbcI (DUF457 family)
VPSPLGHALGGFAAGWLIAPEPAGSSAGPDTAATSWWRRLVRSRRAWVYVAAGLVADLDLLVGLHSRYTHSLGAVLLILAVTLWWTRHRGRAALLLSLAVAASYGSHVLLDWLAEDTSPPIGIMALWPFDSGFFISPVHVFLGISRQYWLAPVWTQNIVAVARELVILAPLAWAVGRFRSRNPGASA